MRISFFAPRCLAGRALSYLTTIGSVGMFVIMPRSPLYRYREKLDDGAIIEVVVWDVPMPVVGSAHHFKYRCFYGYPGRRLVGYDNERPQGRSPTLREARGTLSI